MAKKNEKVEGKFTIKNNLFFADEDVFVTKDDGRKILVAKEGTSIGLDRAVQLGAIEPEDADADAGEEKAADKKANKSLVPAENK